MLMELRGKWLKSWRTSTKRQYNKRGHIDHNKEPVR